MMAPQAPRLEAELVLLMAALRIGYVDSYWLLKYQIVRCSSIWIRLPLMRERHKL
jgi:general stress protein CsbA